MTILDDIRETIRAQHLGDEEAILANLIETSAPGTDQRARIRERAIALVEDIRGDADPGLMEVFLAEYGLSTHEGIALMCLAEALLRVPDAATIDDLIEDKIAPSSWGTHLGHSSSSLVNASTWALMLTGRVLDDDRSKGIAHTLHGAVKRLGEPVIRSAVRRAIKEMGNQFVLGETIEDAVLRGMAREKKGFTYSYDMLGEAAMTAADAGDFFNVYKDAIGYLTARAACDDIRDNPGISIKLSALHPRYEANQKDRMLPVLAARVRELALAAKAAKMGLNIDAEEADRLDLSLDVVETVLADPGLAGWDGFGVVVQAYGKRAAPVIDWLYAMADRLDRRIMVRLVKGAYWDTEIKRAQVEGIGGFPVFGRKAATDVSYICCARKLLGMTDRLYPQFATHNAHSVAAVLEMADTGTPFEFQRLHGMGEALHRNVLNTEGSRCRIYAPVGAHRDLLAYLVRRLLENGANSSFVNQIVDADVPAREIAADPFDVLTASAGSPLPFAHPADLFRPERANSKGFDLKNADHRAAIDAARDPFRTKTWQASPLMAVPHGGTSPLDVINPADSGDKVGTAVDATADDVRRAIEAANPWQDDDAKSRAAILARAADLYEENFGELFAVLTREAGKTPLDAIAEVREAIDFLRYYGARIAEIPDSEARGLIACISPWNFPLAIFSGQIAAALAAGNGVLAKPAEPTPLVATLAVKLLHKAGVPRTSLQLLPGPGNVVGAMLSSDSRIDGICFTGSTATAQTINRNMAAHLAPGAPLIAETGGINAMIVDSTALPEQSVKDIVISAFQSAGQRCSALRVLYVQRDIADRFFEMLFGAMDELALGNPWHYGTDIGPVINAKAQKTIIDHIADAKDAGRLLKTLDVPGGGTFAPPSVISVSGIKDVTREIFGPVLHVATFDAEDLETVVADINGSGYGLTFGLHTRIDDRVEHLTSSLRVGNMYVNRNQIGAIVGSQPFGGEGLSGTGPKAGGPRYVARFTRPASACRTPIEGTTAETAAVQTAIDRVAGRPRGVVDIQYLPGPTGESNRLTTLGRGVILCLGPSEADAREQAHIAGSAGCASVIVAPGATGDCAVPGHLDRATLSTLTGIDGVALWSGAADQRTARAALAARDGRLIPLITETGADMAARCVIERHVCVDTTAAGGNASLLAASGK